MPNARRVLLARCPKCERQHQYGSERQLQRALDRGDCKFCATEAHMPQDLAEI